MPVFSISVCQGIQVGVYLLHTRRTFPSLSCYLKTLSSGSSFILLLSLDCQIYFSSSLSVLSSLASLQSLFFFCLTTIPKTWFLDLVLFVSYWLSVFSPYSCTESTGSNWETLPDGRRPVCWQRDNGENKQGRARQAAEATAGGIIITLWPWSHIKVIPLLQRSLARTPNAKVSKTRKSTVRLKTFRCFT